MQVSSDAAAAAAAAKERNCELLYFVSRTDDERLPSSNLLALLSPSI